MSSHSSLSPAEDVVDGYQLPLFAGYRANDIERYRSCLDRPVRVRDISRYIEYACHARVDYRVIVGGFRIYACTDLNLVGFIIILPGNSHIQCF